MNAISTNAITRPIVIQCSILSIPLFFWSNSSTSLVPTMAEPMFFTLPDCKIINTISINDITIRVINNISAIIVFYCFCGLFEPSSFIEP